MVILLLSLGAATALAGVVWALMARVSVERAGLPASGMPILPVHEYAQYTQRSSSIQHLVVFDPTSLWIGITVAAFGVVVVATGALVAFAGRRTA